MSRIDRLEFITFLHKSSGLWKEAFTKQSNNNAQLLVWSYERIDASFWNALEENNPGWWRPQDWLLEVCMHLWLFMLTRTCTRATCTTLCFCGQLICACMHLLTHFMCWLVPTVHPVSIDIFFRSSLTLTYLPSTVYQQLTDRYSLGHGERESDNNAYLISIVFIQFVNYENKMG